MATYLLLDDALRSPEMRHEIGEPIMDAVIFIEHEGKRIVVGGQLEKPVLEARDDIIDLFWSNHELGYEDLVKDEGFPRHLHFSEIARRALEKLGAGSVVVPASFHVTVADYLRENKIEVVVDVDVWDLRRRAKSPWEIEGIERAQRATETAMLTAARMLRDAERTGQGQLRFEGEILTSELVRETMSAELMSQDVESLEILIQTGDACLRAHELGSGPILPDQPCIIDCFPRDLKTGVYTDMTRTFVPGTPSAEIVKIHGHVREALEIAKEHLRPGSNKAHAAVADFFASHGYPTRETHEGDAPLEEGFNHSLGHGVGLQVHEAPSLGRRPDELVVGDVVAIEPGLYFRNIGGVRLEDTVVITEEGPQHFTDTYPYDLAP
jgi:Xaa-Pro aminopeptidase